MIKNDNAQMMVLEAIIFSITVVISLIFLTQISPTTLSSSSDTTAELKHLGDDALNTLYTQTMYIQTEFSDNIGYTTNNPTSKLAVCLINNSYKELTKSFNEILPTNVLYNIYISNGTKTIFWCSFGGDPNAPAFPMSEPVALSHHPVALDPKYLSPKGKGGFYESNSALYDNYINPLSSVFETPYADSTYEVILEMCYINAPS